MDKEAVLAAVSRNGYALMDAPPALQADKEVVLAAVSQRGGALMYASPEMQGDKEVVLAAVSRHGIALVSASPAMKADKEVVLTAVSNYGYALKDASPALKADLEVVLAAMSQKLGALEYADPALRGSPEFLWRASNIGYVPTPEEEVLIQRYDDSRKATLMPLLASTRRAPDFSKPTEEIDARKKAAWNRVNAHGPIFGEKFKKAMAGFAGVGGKRRTRRKRKFF